MKKTITLETLFIPILAILMIGAFGISNAYAQQSSSCTGECTAPTIGMSWNHQQLVTGGVTINGQAIDITGFSQTVTTKSVSTGNTVNVVLKVYEDTSVGSYFSHATLTIQDSFMAWNKAPDGTETTTVDDNSNILQSVNVRANTLNPLLTEVSFSFQFTQPMETELMKVTVWDSRKNVNNFHLDEAFTVTGMPLTMSKSMPTMSDNAMMDEGPCNRGTVFVVNTFTGLTSCILKHHVSIWNNYGWTT